MYLKLWRILGRHTSEVKVLQVQDGWKHQLQPGKDLPMWLLHTLTISHSLSTIMEYECIDTTNLDRFQTGILGTL